MGIVAGLLALAGIVAEADGPAIEDEAAAAGEAIEAEAPAVESAIESGGEAVAKDAEAVAGEAEAEGGKILNKLDEAFGDSDGTETQCRGESSGGEGGGDDGDDGDGDEGGGDDGDGEDTWGNPNTLQDHFDRHGADFGASSPEDYARQAHDFFERAQSEHLPTKVDPDTGVIRVWDPETDAFGSYNPDGTTKTFYKPNPAVHGYPTNLDYWNAQPPATPGSPMPGGN